MRASMHWGIHADTHACILNIVHVCEISAIAALERKTRDIQDKDLHATTSVIDKTGSQHHLEKFSRILPSVVTWFSATPSPILVPTTHAGQEAKAFAASPGIEDGADHVVVRQSNVSLLSVEVVNASWLSMGGLDGGQADTTHDMIIMGEPEIVSCTRVDDDLVHELLTQKEEARSELHSNTASSWLDACVARHRSTAQAREQERRRGMDKETESRAEMSEMQEARRLRAAVGMDGGLVKRTAHEIGQHCESVVGRKTSEEDAGQTKPAFSEVKARDVDPDGGGSGLYGNVDIPVSVAAAQWQEEEQMAMSVEHEPNGQSEVSEETARRLLTTAKEEAAEFWEAKAAMKPEERAVEDAKDQVLFERMLEEKLEEPSGQRDIDVAEKEKAKAALVSSAAAAVALTSPSAQDPHEVQAIDEDKAAAFLAEKEKAKAALVSSAAAAVALTSPSAQDPHEVQATDEDKAAAFLAEKEKAKAALVSSAAAAVAPTSPFARGVRVNASAVGLQSKADEAAEIVQGNGIGSGFEGENTTRESGLGRPPMLPSLTTQADLMPFVPEERNVVPNDASMDKVREGGGRRDGGMSANAILWAAAERGDVEQVALALGAGAEVCLI